MSHGGVTLEAHPVAGEDAYLELFDDNLPELGIAAIRVVVRNGRDAALSWEKAQWRLQTGSRKYASLNSDGVLRRYHKGRGIRFLTVHAGAAGAGAAPSRHVPALPCRAGGVA